PSIVVTSRPAACAARKQHELTGRPSTRTVQAPQTWTSQERFAPVRPSESRRKSSSSSFGATSRTTSPPLTLRAISTRSPARPRDRSLPGLPVLGHDRVPVLDRLQLPGLLRRDRTQLAERGRDRLQPRRPLERRRRQHGPGYVLADGEHAVVLEQHRPPMTE